YIQSGTRALLRKLGLLPETLRPSRSPLLIDRRREPRSPRISPCTYGLMRSLNVDGVVLEEGRGTAVNESPTGLRLLLTIAPVTGQILEIQTGDLPFGPAISIVEVCWTKPLVHDGQEGWYLVGCRLTFGPMRTQTLSSHDAR